MIILWIPDTPLPHKHVWEVSCVANCFTLRVLFRILVHLLLFHTWLCCRQLPKNNPDTDIYQGYIFKPPKIKKRDFAKRLHNLIANYRALLWGLVPEYFKVAITHFIFMVSLFDSYRRRFNFPRNFMSCWRNVYNIYTSKDRFLAIFWSNTLK